MELLDIFPYMPVAQFSPFGFINVSYIIVQNGDTALNLGQIILTAPKGGPGGGAPRLGDGVRLRLV